MTGKPGGLQSAGSQRVGGNSATKQQRVVTAPVQPLGLILLGVFHPGASGYGPLGRTPCQSYNLGSYKLLESLAQK